MRPDFFCLTFQASRNTVKFLKKDLRPGVFKPFSDFYWFLARNNCRSDMPDFTIQDTDLDEFAELDDASSLFACDSDVLLPCDPVAFNDAGITLLLILVLGFCAGLVFKWYRN